MPRANRHYIPGVVWHITHRCHKKEFLLKFARDRRRWLRWLFEAKKRFGVSVLNYMVTSNRIHLLVRDGRTRDVIPKSRRRRATNNVGHIGGVINPIPTPRFITTPRWIGSMPTFWASGMSRGVIIMIFVFVRLGSKSAGVGPS